LQQSKHNQGIRWYIGATPLLSAIFHDEPTVMAFFAGLRLSATGNMSLTFGRVLRMQYGVATDGATPVCQSTGASFEYLVGNVIADNGQTLFPALW
jgi:5'-nucleotidase